jgi:hypothetical protein
MIRFSGFPVFRFSGFPVFRFSGGAILDAAVTRSGTAQNRTPRLRKGIQKVSAPTLRAMI